MGWFSDFAPVIGGGLGFAVGGPVGALAGASIGSQYANYQLGKENYGLQSANLDYQKALQQQIFQREDNAVQRRVADLTAAGLSPVLAAGSAASAGPIINTTAPQHPQNVPDISAVLPLFKMKADIAVTEAQKDLIDHQKAVADSQTDLNKSNAAVKWNDYEIFKKTGTTSNLGGIGNDLRNLLGFRDSSAVKSIKADISNKINSIPSLPARIKQARKGDWSGLTTEEDLIKAGFKRKRK